MMKNIFKLALTVGCVAMFYAGNAAALDDESERDPEKLAVLFKSLEGDWVCKGKNSAGNPTGAKKNFWFSEGGEVLNLSHHNRVRNTNRITGSWSFDGNYKKLAVAQYYFSPDGVFFSVLASDNWNEKRVVLPSLPVLGPLWRDNRTIYEVTSKNEFTTTWEVENDGVWTMGDTTTCTRVV